ncbi:4-hydroxy-tetrahydrodipicolinate synthase [Exophiala dermatitidis]
MSKQTQELRGVMVALTTPFTEDGSQIDVALLKTHINRLLDAGIHGLVPGGSTGEFTALSFDERKQLLEQVIEITNGRVPVIAGIGSLSTKEDIELARHAAKVGASALMVVPPFYDAPSYEEVKELMREVHEAANGLPIVYYNIPSASGVKLSPSEIAGLSEVGVKYLKDTSGDAPALTELIFGHSDEITTFNGWDTLTFYALAAGCKGTVWGASNVIPELTVQLWETLAVKRDLVAAEKLWKKIWPICAFLERHNYAAAIKTAMEVQGYRTGGVRKPFKLLADKHKEEVKGLLANV